MTTMSILSATPGTPCNFQAPRPSHRSLLITTKRHYTSCRASGSGVDRRDVLIGLGGAAAGLSASSGAVAAPVQSPDLTKCHRPKNVDEKLELKCCPPIDPSVKIVDYRCPPPWAPMRVRPAVQLIDDEYLDKYEKAYALMKELPADDPRSFEQQWKVHCAYCEGAYDQVGFPNVQIQVHECWLFFPFHRFYLHFHEKILGKLIGDPTFGLPFWNWDTPDGMMLPAIYNRESSSLYNPNRNPKHVKHLPPTVLNLNYQGEESKIAPEDLVINNLFLMNKQMYQHRNSLFMGQPYVAGQLQKPGKGSMENAPHGTIHWWTGHPDKNGEDMGQLYSAGRDPAFYSHHANIDRLWCVWRDLHPRHQNFTDPDWLNANFLLYDEEARLVRVKVRDCLETAAMRYEYQDVPLPWLNFKPRPASSKKGPAPPPAATVLPATLDKTVRFSVRRPKVSRSALEKQEEEEMLVLEGIQLSDHSSFIKFDVLVNYEPKPGQPEEQISAEWAGSFVHIPHKHDSNHEAGDETAARIGISDLLDDIGADGDKSIAVTLLPLSNGKMVTVASARIEFCK